MLMKSTKTDDQESETEILQEKLQKIKEQEGIIGYILRNSKSASIDLNDPTKIIDYAVLSSTAIDTGNDMTETLQLGEVDTIVLETEETKLLSMKTNDHNLSIFMEKTVDHDKLFKRLK
jgi:predicted regulator of Ras-like GTPase activity (Roadblock/LC7/MglB family)